MSQTQGARVAPVFISDRSLDDVPLPSGTEELTLFRCSVKRFEKVEALHQLRTLRVMCCRIPERLEINLPTLRHLEITFSTLTDATALTRMPLQTLRLFGVPIDPASRRALNSSQARFVEISPEKEWLLTRQLWDRGARVCFGQVPGIWSAIAKPGSPKFSEIRDYELSGDLPSYDDDALIDIGYFEAGKVLDGVEHFTCPWETGDAEDAKRWVDASQLNEADKICLRNLIARFSGERFYRAQLEGLEIAARLQKTRIPARMREFYTTVLQSIGKPTRSWRARLSGYDKDWLGRGSTSWYWLGLVGYPSRESEPLLKERSMYCVGDREFEDGSGEQCALAISSLGDEAVYEFRELDLFDEQRRGKVPDPRRYPVFRSWSSLLSHVVQLEKPKE